MKAARLAVALGACGLIAACAPDAPEPAAETDEQEEAVVADSIGSVAWSRDGARLAVAWRRSGRARVYGLFGPHDSVPPEPSAGLPITSGDGRSPTWSPDGLWLAFSTTRDGDAEIYRVRPDGTGPERLTADSAQDTGPAYAPDGRRLAFVTDRGGAGPRVWIMDAAGGNARPLGFDIGEAQHAPAWSPDGRALAFTIGEGRRRMIWRSAADGSDARVLWPGDGPSWAPDGRSLYYGRSDSIFVRSPGPDEQERYVTDGREARPSPNGRWLAIVRGNRGDAALYLLDLESLESTRITP